MGCCKDRSEEARRWRPRLKGMYAEGPLMVLGTRDGVAGAPFALLPRFPRRPALGIFETAGGARVGWGVTLQTWAIPMTPTF